MHWRSNTRATRSSSETGPSAYENSANTTKATSSFSSARAKLQERLLASDDERFIDKLARRLPALRAAGED